MSDANMVSVDVWVVVDSEGAYGVGVCEDTATESYDADNSSNGARRMVCITVSLPAPRPCPVLVTLPAESEVCAVKVG